jgi:hypothetical protein
MGAILEDIRRFEGEIPYSKVEELRDVIQKYAYGKGGLTPESKRAVKALYKQINTSVDKSLRSQGLENVADELKRVNTGFKTLYRMQDLGLERLAPSDVVSGTTYQKYIKELGSEQYSPQFGATKKRLDAYTKSLLRSPVIKEEEKAGLRSVLSEGEDVAKQLREAEAAKFTAPEELVDQDIISQRVMGTLS